MSNFSPCRVLIAAVLLATSLGVAEARAADTAVPTLTLAQGGGMSLEQAINSVQRRYGGRVIEARTIVRNGREIHVVKIIDSKSTVRTVQVPGRSVGRY